VTTGRDEIGGLVLAGGKGRRMGGRDKAFLALAGVPLIASAVARLAPQVGGLAISSNRAAATFSPLTAPVLPDVAGAGPLAGLLAGLAWARGQGFASLQTVAVDTPFFPVDLVARLAAVAAGGVAVARSSGRVHPVFALVPVALADDLARHLEEGASLRVGDWLARQGPAFVDFEGPAGCDPFFNINTPEDLDAATGCAAAALGES
jgi:molybdopterin-guanine dinucleotide biosynthesis protein A